MMSIKEEPDIKIKTEADIKTERKDPTSFLPDEPMSYEIKSKKKKKKKKKTKQEDPFKDIEEKSLVTQRVSQPEVEPEPAHESIPEVTIKVENIEVELDFNDVCICHILLFLIRQAVYK